MGSQPSLASLDTSVKALDGLPPSALEMFAAKAGKGLTFGALAEDLGRSEVAVAALFMGQAQASEADVDKLSNILGMDRSRLVHLTDYPNRGYSVPSMPPKEPLIYRLYEIVQNYGSSYKAVMNEKFGDGIMSAIAFSTRVDKETVDGADWCVITLRGKWLPYTRF